jgi:hypothetical protein
MNRMYPPYWPQYPMMEYQPPMRREDEDFITYIRRCKRELKEVEDEFKKDADKKKPSGKGLDVLQIWGILMLASIPVGMLQLTMLKYFATYIQATLH